ncbi:DUF1996 domain-containing protein [Actinomycetota bacterium Odt1-20B]
MRRTPQRSSRKRSKLSRRLVTAAAALLLGGGGLIAVNFYANAEDGPDAAPPDPAARMATIDCPDATDRLPEVPRDEQAERDRRLADLDSQITEAYTRFQESADQQSVLGPLEQQRRTTLDQLGPGLDDLAPCTLRAADGTGQPSGGGAAPPPQGNGPDAGDFVPITSVRPNAALPRERRGASRGSFTTKCGRNENGKFNPDNVIVAPGVSNGAHHMHDYVGNQATDAFASDDDLANGATSCRNQGDKSTYYWPVLRLRNGKAENDAGADGGGKDQNVGEIQTPAAVTLKFAGSPVSKVAPMPRFLRIITGDAKAFTNGDANANASWSCTGFENRQLKDKYPICPRGSKVVRTFRFQSCWDGRNTDSAGHRTHVAFADRRTGACPQGFRAIPQLVQRIVYDVPPGPGFAVDSFPEQLHKPVTDHGDFINVFDQRLMRRVADCLNSGRACA